MKQAAIATVAALILSSGVPCKAQEAPMPVFRSTADLVRLDVRVTDESGSPVRDMRAEEFEIIERDQSRPVLVFQQVRESERSYQESAAETIGGEVSTNIGAPRGHFYALVFDQLHITSGREQRVRNAAIRFIDRHLKPGDRIAIFSVPGPGAALTFTTDLERARTALDRVRGMSTAGGRGGITSGGIRVFEAFQIINGDDSTARRVMARIGNDPAYSGLTTTLPGGEDTSASLMILREEASRVVAEADMESRAFLSLFTDALRTMRPIEGRKAVVVFSEGFIIDNLTQEVESVAAAAADSYSVVYSIDLNTFDIGPEEDQLDASSRRLAEVTARRDPLATLALETDGRMVANATNFDQILGNVAAEANEYYLLGFEPGPGNRKEGEYQRVKVRVKRAGVQVRARTGYAAPGDPNPATRRRTIDQALSSPVAVTALPLEYTTYQLRGESGKSRIIASMLVQLPAGGDPNQVADVVFVARDLRTGASVASGTDRLRMPDPAVAAPGALTPVPYRVQFELSPGEYIMRVVVREPGGLIGTADRRFQVRPLKAAGATSSDLVLISGENRTIDPPTRVVVGPAQRLNAYLEVYDATATSPIVTLDILSRDDDRVRASVQAAVSVEAGKHVARGRLPLESLPAGSYIVRTRVSNAAGAGSVSRSFELTGTGEAVSPPSPAFRFDVATALRDARVIKYREDLAAGTSDLDRRASTALSDLEQGKYGEAVRALNELAGLAPDNPQFPYLLGVAHAAQGDDRSAIGVWRLTVRVEQRWLEAHLLLADACMRLNQPALAQQALRAAIVALPDADEIWDRLAAIKQ